MNEWRTMRLRRLFEPPVGGTWGSEPGESDLDVRCIRGTDFDTLSLRVSIERAPIRSVTRAEWAARRLRPGDIVIEKSGGGDTQPVGRAVLFETASDAVPTNFAARLRPAAWCSSRYLVYLFATCYASGATRRSIKQTTGIQNLDMDSFLANSVLVPGERVQREIAGFLDAQTSRIDALIEKKRLMVDVLRQRWTVTRRNAVTVGIQANVPRRATGISWLKEVPIHWRTSKLQHLADIRSGSTPSTEREDYWDGDVPWVSPKDMKRFEIDSSRDCVTARAVEEAGLHLAQPGCVLFVVRGMILAHTFPVAVNSVPVTINQDMKALSLKQDDPRFLAHLLAGVGDSVLALLVEESAHGTRVLRMDCWKEFPLFLAPHEEQREIVRFLDEETERVNAITARIDEQVALLREHRRALITAAVTGELDVSKAAA